MTAMDMRSPTETAALVFVTVMFAIGIYLVPSWHGLLTDPCLIAAALAIATLLLLHVTRRFGPRAIPIERQAVAAFLAGMPLVYIASFFTRGGDPGGVSLAVEILGLCLYGGLAVAGFRGRPRLLAVGIAAHGLAWDAWHLESAYIPRWYAIACLVVDVGLAVYVAARVPAWLARSPGAKPSGADHGSAWPAAGAHETHP